MSQSASVDLDRVTKKAWNRFQGELADRIADLGPGEVLVVAVEPCDEPRSGCAPYLQFRGDEADSVVGQVSGNRYLDPAHRLGKEARGCLTAMGWSAPRPKRGLFNFVATVHQSRADQLAVMAVSVLHDVFGVAHPAFLIGDVHIADDPELPSVEVSDQAVEPLAVMPRSHEHLDQLVNEALVPILGQEPSRDDDGDIPVVNGTAVVFIRSFPHSPVIKIWAEVVVHVTDLNRAKFEVEILNRDRPFAKFALADDRITAQTYLPAAPFVPSHLRETLAMMCVLADEIDDDLAVRVSGRRFVEPHASQDADAESDGDDKGAEELHPAMLTLLQLDADRPGSIKPSMAAKVCGYDPGLLLQLIRWNEEQEIEWRSARDEARMGDLDEEAKVCDHERKHAHRTTKLLRKALRYVVEQEETTSI